MNVSLVERASAPPLAFRRPTSSGASGGTVWMLRRSRMSVWRRPRQPMTSRCGTSC